MKIEDLTNKKVVVVGLGVSGQAVSRLLLSKGASVWITDKERNAELDVLSEYFVGLGANVELGGHTRDFVREASLIIISPGIAYNCKIFKWAEEDKTVLISELEFASWFANFPLIAITGTNGKSTVTRLIECIFKHSNIKTLSCGNIGFPLSDVIMKHNDLDVAIIEVSSFQLEFIETFKPKIAVWLNFSHDHIDQHITMDKYLNAKLNIFVNQKEDDWAVVYYEEINRIKRLLKSKTKIFNKDIGKYKNSKVFCENINASIAVAEIYGIKKEIIEKAIWDFKLLPHRLEYVAEIDGIEFVDDSKSTNISSVIAALNSINKKVILLLGGKDKRDDFSKLKNIINDKVRLLIAIGETRDKIVQQLKEVVPIKTMLDISKAINFAFDNANYGEVVLLSPGCSSFDMFENYKERGKVFQKCVNNLKSKVQILNAK